MADPASNERPDDTGRKATSASSFVHRTDLVLTLLIFAACGALYYVTTSFEEVSELLSQNIGPEWFPRLLIWTIVVLSLALPFEHLSRRHRANPIDKDRSARIKPISFLTAALLAGVVGTIPLFGTLVATILGCALLPLLWGERRLKILIPYIVLFPATVAILFTQVLKVYFEPGLWGPTIG
jgi:putative tricarboxylic transport membrane protein